MALILVILVLSALVMVGTPFILSMKLQERGSVHTMAQKRADLAAISARNHAVAQAMDGRTPMSERRVLSMRGIGLSCGPGCARFSGA